MPCFIYARKSAFYALVDILRKRGIEQCFIWQGQSHTINKYQNKRIKKQYQKHLLFPLISGNIRVSNKSFV